MKLAVIHFMLGGSVNPMCMKRTITVESPKPRGPWGKERREKPLAKQQDLQFKRRRWELCCPQRKRC
eukprot:g16240.t1